MTRKITINDQSILNRQQKLRQTGTTLSGKLVADLKPAELSALVELLAARLHLLDEENRISLSNLSE